MSLCRLTDKQPFLNLILNSKEKRISYLIHIVKYRIPAKQAPLHGRYKKVPAIRGSELFVSVLTTLIYGVVYTKSVVIAPHTGVIN